MKHILCGSILVLGALKLVGASSGEAVTYKSVRVDNLDIFYREAGPPDGPVVLLLHGFPSSSRMYQALLDSNLNTRYHLIAPDYPGFGHSSWPDRQNFHYTFDHLAEAMQDFAHRLQWAHLRSSAISVPKMDE
jgi:pimeloyl-ACP methyl ester carboxylesterase